MLGLDAVHTTCSRGEKQEEGEEEKEDGGGKKWAAGDSDPADSASPPTPAEGKIDGEHQPPPPPLTDEDGSEGEGGGSAESAAAAAAAPELLRFKIEMDLGLDTRCETAADGCERRRGGGGSDVVPRYKHGGFLSVIRERAPADMGGGAACTLCCDALAGWCLLQLIWCSN